MVDVCAENDACHALYPLFVDLHNQPVLVVGAGNVAQRKIETLLRYGALVHVVALQANDWIRDLAEQGTIRLSERAFSPEDMQGVVFAIAATDNDVTNKCVYDAAQECNVFVNVVDVPQFCTASLASVLHRGLLQIAVSTSGAAPSLARRVRSNLEDLFPAWWEQYVQLLAETRALIKERVTGPAQVRTPLFEALTDSRLEKRIATGEQLTAEDVYEQYVKPLLADEHQEAAYVSAAGDAV